MIKLYNELEFKNGKFDDKFKVQCEICNCEFYKKKRDINKVIRNLRPGKYCSKQCQSIAKTTSKLVKCLQCEKEFTKLINQIKKTKNNFCSNSCAAKHMNLNKVKGTRVSKLEIWLREQLNSEYPNFIIIYNGRETINSELDIYIPELKLAFELNGIFHYEPIFGKDKLDKIQNNDNRKFQACLEKEIELVIMDVSSMTYFKPIKGQKYLDIITKIINNKSLS